MKNPCKKDCPRRRAGTKEAPSCHADCEAYKAYWDENRARNAEEHFQNELYGIKVRGVQKADKARRAQKDKAYHYNRRG